MMRKIAGLLLITLIAMSAVVGWAAQYPLTVLDLSVEGNDLLVHVLHTDDVNAVRDEIKTRYERRLLEIFS